MQDNLQTLIFLTEQQNLRAASLQTSLRPRSCSSHQNHFLLRHQLARLLNLRRLTAAVCRRMFFFLFFFCRVTGKSFSKHLKIISVHTDWNNHGWRTRGARIMGLKFHGKRQKSRCWFILTTAAVLPRERNHVVIAPNMRPKHTLTQTAVFY